MIVFNIKSLLGMHLVIVLIANMWVHYGLETAQTMTGSGL